MVLKKNLCIFQQHNIKIHSVLKNTYVPFALGLFFLTLCFYSCKNNSEESRHEHGQGNWHEHSTGTVKDVDISLFDTQESSFEIAIVLCTLSNGLKTKCYEIKTKGLIPKDHEVGPWCIDDITDGKEKGGIWFKDGEVYNVDGEFIKNLPELYHDDHWHLYDEDGKVNKTLTEQDCIELKSAQLVDKFENFCIECLPEYTGDISKTYVIPITPVKLETPISLGGGGPPPDRDQNSKPQGPPPNGGGNKKGPAVRGIALNGVAFDAPAPLHIILAGYSIPPLDKAGGHINLDSGYHYHAATGATKKVEQEDNHSELIGYAMDGYGIYAYLDKEGNPPVGLDQCRGQYDEIRGYHYHADQAGNNNFINCFSGAIAQ